MNMSPEARENQKRDLEADLKTLLENAKFLNLVVTVELQPKKPLAMGNYEMVGNIREANNVYRGRT